MITLRGKISPLLVIKALLVCGCYLAASQYACAQGLYNGADLFISGTNVYVNGEILNAGNLMNDGHLAFTEDWENKGIYNGGGILELNGRAPQKVIHNGQEASQLLINGWGTKYIKGKMEVSGSFHLNQGIVEVSTGDVLKLQAGTTIQGGTDQSYVDGPLTVEGTGYRFFPIGKNGTYAPIEFLNVKGGAAEFSVEVFESAPVVSVEDVIVKRSLYWQRNDIIGKFGGSPVAVDFDREYFQDTEKITMLTGNNWDEPFSTVEVDHSGETAKIISRKDIFSPILMLGEISLRWTDADFYFSTALSPNAAHAENRTVKIFGERLDAGQFHFQVFNRWGELVFETTSLERMSANGWDGRSMSGAELTTGTYPYRLSALDKSGRNFERKGVITLIH